MFVGLLTPLVVVWCSGSALPAGVTLAHASGRARNSATTLSNANRAGMPRLDVVPPTQESRVEPRFEGVVTSVEATLGSAR